MDSDGFIRRVELLPERVRSFEEYPYSIPALRGLRSLPLAGGVTVLAGEKGCLT